MRRWTGSRSRSTRSSSSRAATSLMYPVTRRAIRRSRSTAAVQPTSQRNDKMPLTQKQVKDLIAHYSDPRNASWCRIVTAESPKGQKIITPGGALAVEIFTVGEVVKNDAAEYSVKHFISTPQIDYVMDVMNPFGMNARPMEKNRGVFFNHKWDQPGNDGLPIGRNLWLQPEKGGVLAKTKFAVGVTKKDFAGDIYRLTIGGYLPSWSIGFFVTDMKMIPLSE